MRKIIAAFNQTIDGFADHTAGVADAEIHQHYADLIKNSGVLLYGRTTFELMKFWQDLAKNPSGETSMDDFAVAMEKAPKIVFSNTMQNTGWDSATLATQSLEEVVRELRQQPGKDVLVGSRSLIVQLMNLDLIDELQLCIHPVLIGKGLPLFDDIKERMVFKLLKTKTFEIGAVILYYNRK